MIQLSFILNLYEIIIFTVILLFRIVLVSILSVHKHYTDAFFFNSFIAALGGMLIEEINFLEQEFLEMIDFNLSVSTEEYNNYEQSLNEYF